MPLIQNSQIKKYQFMRDDLTIVIPCKNEEKYIGQTIMSIYYQRGIRKTRIVVADGGSTDGTLKILRDLKKNYDLNISIVKGGSVSMGRNSGASHAKTPYILFLDADTTFTRRTAILESLQEMKSRDLDLLSSTPKYKGDFDPAAYLLFRINKITTILLSKIDPFAVGCFTMVRKDTFEKIGGYDETYMHTEDWMFSRKINPSRFGLIPDLITQDNRRFKRFGYLNMIKLILVNYINRNDPEHFRKDQAYWK